jgi:hypothetical protein
MARPALEGMENPMPTKERPHKWGKRNKLRIKAGLPPVTGTRILQPVPLQPEAAPQAPAPSVLAIQAEAIAQLQTDVTKLTKAVEDLTAAYVTAIANGLIPKETK